MLVARISPAVPEPGVPTPRLFIWKLFDVLVAFAVVAVVAVVADVALVADVAVAALPLMLMPHVPLAPEPVVEGTPSADCAVPCVVPPVPPLATASVPPRVNVPDVVIGPPVSVSPVEPPEPETEVTVPLPPAVEAMVMPPALFVTVMPEPAVIVETLYPEPLPIRS